MEEADAPREKRKARHRGFSEYLLRERIELTLTDAEKAGASKVFFTKIKEELQFIPDQLKLLEIWHEKAVFIEHGEELWNECARLVTHAIIYFNTRILSQLLN